MLTAGLYYTLRVNRISDFGLYLADPEGDEVLLPNRYVSLSNKVGDEMEVFVYRDSEDRLVATTDRPLATVGEVAGLKVVDKTIHGAFLDWGLKAKDLFLPNRNMQGRVEIGKTYAVYLYTDNITGRVVASMLLNSLINNQELKLTPREEVEILIALETPIGYRVVINNHHWGMLYSNQLFRPVHIGEHMKAYVARITEDNRVDLTLQQQGYDEVKHSAERLLSLLREQGGTLPLWDGSTPEEVAQLTQMSKKVFKRSVGLLMKQELLTMHEGSLTLTPKGETGEVVIPEQPETHSTPRREANSASSRRFEASPRNRSHAENPANEKSERSRHDDLPHRIAARLREEPDQRRFPQSRRTHSDNAKTAPRQNDFSRSTRRPRKPFSGK